MTDHEPSIDDEATGLLVTAESTAAWIEEHATELGADIESLCHLACQVRETRQAIDAAYRALEGEIIQRAGERRFTIDGIGEIQVKASIRRTKWATDDLLRHATARIMDEAGVLADPETGETRPPWAIGHAVAARLRDVISMSGGKVTGMRQIGLEPDEFCQQDEAVPSLVLPKRKDTTR